LEALHHGFPQLLTGIGCIQVRKSKTSLHLADMLGESVTAIEWETRLVEKLGDDIVSSQILGRDPGSHGAPTGATETLCEFITLVHRYLRADQLAELVPKSSGLVGFSGLTRKPTRLNKTGTLREACKASSAVSAKVDQLGTTRP
jgi:hypothetical protein